MKTTKFFLRPLIVVGALVVLFALSFANHPNADADTNIAWGYDWVDAGAANRGISPVIALNPTTGVPYVSYYDTTNHQLYLAHFVGYGTGTCPNKSGWDCMLTVGSGVPMGYNDMVFDWADNAKIVYATLSPHNQFHLMNVAPNFNVSTTDTSEYYGGYDWDSFSLVRNGNEFASAFHEENSGTGESALIYRANQKKYGGWDEVVRDAGTPGVPSWLGEYPSLAMPTYGQKNPRIAYSGSVMLYGEYVYKHTLNYAEQDENGDGKSCYSGFWTCGTIDPTPHTGYYISLHAPQTDPNDSTVEAVAYFNSDSGTLKYAERTNNANDSCGTFGLTGWKCYTVDSIGSQNGVKSISLKFYRGKAVIAYYDSNEPNYNRGVLKIARQVSSGGNCGVGAAAGKWNCKLVDVAAGSTHDVGQYASLAISSDGRAHIAYYDSTSGDLKVAIEKVKQTLNFAPLPNRTLDQNSFQVKASASSGLPIGVSAWGACSSSGVFVVLEAVGTCNVKVSQDGDNFWYGAVQTQSFQVLPANTPPPTNTPQPTNTPPAPTATPTNPPPSCNNPPVAVMLMSPTNKEKVQKGNVVLDWNDAQCASHYKVTLKKVLVKDGNKTKKIFETAAVNASSFTTTKKLKPAKYFWSVEACNNVGCTPSQVFKFKVK